MTIAPGETVSISNQLYVGPKNQKVLAELGSHLDLVVDYGWLWWIAQPLFWLLTFIQGIVINWGIAIIVLTLLREARFFPALGSRLQIDGPHAQSAAPDRGYSGGIRQRQSQAIPGDDGAV